MTSPSSQRNADVKGLRALLRRWVPAPVRRLLRSLVREVPERLHDLPADLGDWLRHGTSSLPPARLRRRVGLTSTRREFVDVGGRACATLLASYQAATGGEATTGTWLDFGCGPGRVARHLLAAGVDLRGVDVDPAAISWLRSRYGRRFATCPTTPPLDFPSETFDVVVAISVFSHMNESIQCQWLAELARVLRPGGALIASTHGKDLLVTRPDLLPKQVSAFARNGFLFAPGAGVFNDDSAFHEPSYMNRIWSRWLDHARFFPRGLMGYQDLSVWTKTEGR